MTENADQRDFWTDIVGEKWVRNQGTMDALMQPVLDGVLARAGLATGQAVLDVGCGTGASCLAAAAAVGPDGMVLGADISPTLLTLARSRTADHPNITLIEADAALHGFEPAHFDHLISRFGVMFFADPVAAFSNMAAALKPGGQVTFASWGQIQENPYFTDAAQAARETLGPMPKADPDLPGPFAFRDPERVIGILTGAGLTEADADVVPLHLTPPGTLADFAEQAMAIGPVEATIREYGPDAAGLAKVKDTLQATFARYDTEDGLRIPAEIVFYTARAA